MTSSPKVSTLIRGDCRDVLPTLEDGRFSTLVTSPPYLEQRKYGDDPDELGHEPTLAAYASAIADVFELARPKLAPGASAWLNIGDKANGSGGAGGDWAKSSGKRARGGGMGRFRDRGYPTGSYLDVPGAVLRELLRRGWRLRLPIVWHKGRDAPESLAHVNRPRWSHEMIFLLAPGPGRIRFYPSMLADTGSVWTFSPGTVGNPSLAPFPDELARRCILPTTLPGDHVLDPFGGSGTVPRVAAELGRVGVGIDLYAGEPAA